MLAVMIKKSFKKSDFMETQFELQKLESEKSDQNQKSLVNSQFSVKDYFDDHFKNIENKIELVEKKVDKSYTLLETSLVKPKTKKSLGLPKRDPLDKKLYHQIMREKRKPKERMVCHSRFRVAITLLYLFGLRINEIRRLTKEDFIQALEKREFLIYQSKTREFRSIPINKKAYLQLLHFKKDVETIFFKHKYLGGNETKFSSTNWIRFLNKKLAESTKNSGEIIKSHSCRINFVTELLKNHSVQVVSQIVGHKDVKTTLKYDRYLLTKDQINKATEILLD